MERKIKRYANRKLYDQAESRYVTLDQIVRLVKANTALTVTDKLYGADLTALTFAQALAEGLRKRQVTPEVAAGLTDKLREAIKLLPSDR